MMKSLVLVILLAAVATARTPLRRRGRVALKQVEPEAEPEAEVDEYQLCLDECYETTNPEDNENVVCALPVDEVDAEASTYVDLCSAICSNAVPMCDGECPCEDIELPDEVDEDEDEFVDEDEDEFVDEDEEEDSFYEICYAACIDETDEETLEIPACGVFEDDEEAIEMPFSDVCDASCTSGEIGVLLEITCEGEDCECLDVEEEEDDYETCYAECLEDLDDEEFDMPICGFIPGDEEIEDVDFSFVDICDAMCSDAVVMCEGECPCPDDEEVEDEIFEDLVEEIVDRVVEEIVERLSFGVDVDDEEIIVDDEDFEDFEDFEDDEDFDFEDDEFIDEDEFVDEDEDEFVDEDEDEFVDEDEYYEEDEDEFEDDDLAVEEYEDDEEIDDEDVGLTFEDLAALLAERDTPRVSVHIEQVIDVSSD